MVAKDHGQMLELMVLMDSIALVDPSLRGASLHGPQQPISLPGADPSPRPISLRPIIKLNEASIIPGRAWRDDLALLAGTGTSLLLLRLRLLLVPLPKHSVLGWVLERVEAGVVVATVAFKT